MRPKIQMALVMVVFVRFPERDIVGQLFTFYCYLFAKWKSFLGSTNLQNGKASRPLKGSSHHIITSNETGPSPVTRARPDDVRIVG
jgi:hypothetical protein